MLIKAFSVADALQVRLMVLEILAGEGFQYDPLKDSDLEDIPDFYLKGGGAFFVAVDGDEIVGSSAVRMVGSGRCEVKRIYVKSNHRSKGIGTALLLKALDFAEQKCSLATLKTDLYLDDAIRLYLKNGFLIIKEDDGTIYFEKQLH